MVLLLHLHPKLVKEECIRIGAFLDASVERRARAVTAIVRWSRECIATDCLKSGGHLPRLHRVHARVVGPGQEQARQDTSCPSFTWW